MRWLGRAVATLILAPTAGQASTSSSQAPPPASSRQSEAPGLRVGSLGPIRLDGRLDEAEWLTADSITELRQIEPNEGSAPSARTVVRVLANGAALVIGVEAYDPDPSRITTFARERDALLDSEDHVKLVLDTYRDGRSGYVFAVNPNGARYDALVSSQGEAENANWDGIWEAATARTATGWSVEIRIPLKTILFRRGLTEWGFNLQRRIQRLQETDRWASPTRNYKVTHVARAGRLTGLPPFDLGRGLSIRPSLAAGGGIPRHGDPVEWSADPSLDVTQRIRANTLASLTVHTDFAETEVDTRRTNLTRFPLLFPEKRTFFLEGADIFDFGLGTGDDVRPFFSRSVGLQGGAEVPIEAGLKVNGREGRTNFGALVVRTGVPDRPLDTLPTANTMGVLRLRQNVLGESSVGMIATLGDPLGRAASRLGGIDLNYQTTKFRGNKNLLAGVWGLATGRDDLTGRRRAFGGKLDYPNDLWDLVATYKWLGEGFDPSLGFVPRPAVQIVTVGADFMPRPRRRILGLQVRQMFHEFQATYVTDLRGRWESYRVFMAPINWRLESGDRFELNAVPVGERLTEPFEIATGVAVPRGTYRWMRYRMEAQLAAKRRFSGQFTWWFGGFFGGHLDEYQMTTSWKPSALLILELNGTRNVGRLPGGRFVQSLIGGRVRLNVSPDLQLNSYLQYDNESETFGTNTRLRWTFSPVGELFVVYNHNVRTLDPLTRIRSWRFDSNQLLVKAQYAFRY